MTVRTLTVAMLAANAAFADIVHRTLQDRADYRVPRLGSLEALLTFMRISPVDVVVFDTDMPDHSPIETVRTLRATTGLANPFFRTIVLTRAERPFQQPLLAAGVDIVLQKPVPPRQLLGAIDGLHADQRQVGAAGQPRPSLQSASSTAAVAHVPTARVGNVIPLFGHGRSPR